MTPETFASHWLSPHRWMVGCVGPAACAVLLVVFIAIAAGLRGDTLDVMSGSIGTCALFMAGWQGMDMLGARRVHHSLLERYPQAYRARLEAADPAPRTLRDALQLLAWIDRGLHT